MPKNASPPSQTLPEHPKKVGLTIRIDHEKNKVFAALLALEDLTANEWVNLQIDQYIQHNKHLLKEAYEQLEVE